MNIPDTIIGYLFYYLYVRIVYRAKLEGHQRCYTILIMIFTINWKMPRRLGLLKTWNALHFFGIWIMH